MGTPHSGLAELLASGLSALGLETPSEREPRLLAYLELMQRWNRVYNLTAVRAPAAMISRHLLDSLAAAPHLRGTRFIDVGSGAGLPGIPLAIWFPERSFALLDSNGRKTRFLTQVKIELGLANVEVIHARVQDLRDLSRYDGVLSRAFSSLADFVVAAGHLVARNGRLYAFKGVRPDAELHALPEPYRAVAVWPLSLPGTDAERHLVELVASTDTC